MRPQQTLPAPCSHTLGTYLHTPLEHLHAWQTRRTRKLKERPSADDNRASAPAHFSPLPKVSQQGALWLFTVVTGLIKTFYWLPFFPHHSLPPSGHSSDSARSEPVEPPGNAYSTFFPLFQPHPWFMEVPRPGIES